MAKILVVDDEDVVRDLIRETLSIDEAHEMRFARDGSEALAAIAEDAPDVVLLDVFMEGGLDGLEVCRRVSRAAGRKPKIILLTGMSDDALRAAGPRVGAFSFLSKPFSPLELIQQVETVLEVA